MARAVPRRLQVRPDVRDEIDASAASDVGLDRPPRTELARTLVAARREFLAAEGRFLDRDEVSRDLADRRGGADPDDEE